MSHRIGDVSRVAAVALLLCLSAAACNLDGIEAVPSYPGAGFGPGSRVKEGDRTSLKQLYYTPDSYADVIQFYSDYTAGEPGWEGEPATEMSVWTMNMQWDGLMQNGVPIDPRRLGKMIVVTNDGSRTTIRTFSSHPDAESAQDGARAKTGI